MSIYHGQCKGYHETIAEARACSGIGEADSFYRDAAARGTISPEQAARYQRNAYRPTQQSQYDNPENRPQGYTKKQYNFIVSLNKERVVPPVGQTDEEAFLLERNFDIIGNTGNPDTDKSVSEREASAVIKYLLALPMKTPEAERVEGVGYGRAIAATDPGRQVRAAWR